MSAEVRLCSACHEPAAVRTHTVRHVVEMSVNFLPATSATTRQQFRCQHCGAAFELRPPSEANTQMFMAAFFMMVMLGVAFAAGRNLTLTPNVIGVLCAVFGPFELAFGVWFVVAARRKSSWARHPVVAGAPMPPMRFPAPLQQSPRRCARCGASAKLKSLVRHRTQGIPMGTEWSYSCESCNHCFKLASPWRSMKPELIVILILGAAVTHMFVHDSSWLLGFLGAAIALMIYGAFVARGLANRHPLVTEIGAADAASSSVPSERRPSTD